MLLEVGPNVKRKSIGYWCLPTMLLFDISMT